MFADQADRGRGIVEGDSDDIGQYVFRRTLGIGDRNRRVAAPRLGRRIEADFGIVIGAVIGAFALGDLRAAGKRARGLQRHHHRLGAGIGETDLFHRPQARRQQFGQFDLGLGRHAERRSQRELSGCGFNQPRMRMAMDQRGKIIDTVDIFVAVDVKDPAALAPRRIDRIGLHEDGGAAIAAGQAV